MKKQISWGVLVAWLCCCVVLALAGHAQAETAPTVEVAFSPDGGAESLVLCTIGQAHQSIRVLAYSFTAPAVTRALITAKRRGVDVAVTVDARSNFEEDRSGRARAALSALAYAGIPIRVVSIFPAQLVAIDFYLSMHHYAPHAFPALSVWFDVHRLGRRYHVPVVDPLQKIDIPHHG
ncbi:phospholipase D-like domain-containing protein [Burkholderia ambifaria]|uniref:phospholipase D n=1 Tax=Burkholderia ambifaria MEX-5 TaxID=396597 RepID=B1T0C5_9BURK|nr:phospholipase D-like domain-containing protein [Burkholderia ambifaria]EDT42936.1 hypothetical protein BamMEX5DRAFT_1241 [Burkholderia ambifaria MEX-5]